MLALIGLGLKEKDMSLEGLEIAKAADLRYLEDYTSRWKGDLEGLVGSFKTIDRKGVEQGNLVEQAKSKDVALLIPGDPLAATTHIELLIEARKQGVETKVVHAPSIFSVMGETGLQMYKFGRTVTVPSDSVPPSVKEAVKKNREAGLHTLLLLDPGLSAEKALGMLGLKEKVVVAHFGKDTAIVYTSPEKVKKFAQPAVIVVPGELHFKEKEYLEMLG